MLLEENAHILFALANSVFLIAVPGAGFFHDAVGNTKIDQFAKLGNALAVEDFEFGILNGVHLVLDDLDSRLVADDFITFS